MQVVLGLHLLCAFVWLFSALVESVGAASPTVRMFGELVEGRIDLVVELPAFLGVLITGGYLASHEPLTPLHTLKIAAGLMTIGLNVYGLQFVRDPSLAAPAGRGSAQRVGSGALVALAMGLAIGFHLLARG